MLLETRDRCRREGLTPELVRCDSAKLPFLSGSLDAVHAGAALHCWPKVPQSVSEIHRVLRPGGVFYASTFLADWMGKGKLDDGKGGRINTGFNYFDSTEQLYKIVTAAGFTSVNVRQEGKGCAIIRATKE
jgi:SAM-dependent methyltransferase